MCFSRAISRFKRFRVTKRLRTAERFLPLVVFKAIARVGVVLQVESCEEEYAASSDMRSETLWNFKHHHPSVIQT